MRQASEMRRLQVTAALALGLILLGSGAFAQAPPQQVPPPVQAPAPDPVPPTPQRKLNLTVEQRFTIREIIRDEKSKPAQAQASAPAVGDAIPQDIQLRPMPDAVAQKVPQVKSHKFFVAKDEIVIVDPKDNTVAELIKLER